MINIDTRILAKITESEYWLLCHIAKRLDDKSACFPSNETLMKDTGWGKEKLQSNKKSLISKKILAIENRFKDNRQTSNYYRIKTPFIGVFVTLKELTKEGVSGGEGAENPTPMSGGKSYPPEGAVKHTAEVLARDEVLYTEPSGSGIQTEAFVDSIPHTEETNPPEPQEAPTQKKVFQRCVDIWAKTFPMLMVGFGAVGGRKMNSIIKKIKQTCVNGNIVPTDEVVVSSFERLTKFIDQHEFYRGQDLSVIDSKFAPIAFEMKHGKKKDVYRQRQSSQFTPYRG